MRHLIKTVLTASAVAATVLLIGCEATGPASSKIGRLFIESHYNEDGTPTQPSRLHPRRAPSMKPRWRTTSTLCRSCAAIPYTA